MTHAPRAREQKVVPNFNKSVEIKGWTLSVLGLGFWNLGYASRVIIEVTFYVFYVLRFLRFTFFTFFGFSNLNLNIAPKIRKNPIFWRQIQIEI